MAKKSKIVPTLFYIKPILWSNTRLLVAIVVWVLLKVYYDPGLIYRDDTLSVTYADLIIILLALFILFVLLFIAYTRFIVAQRIKSHNESLRYFIKSSKDESTFIEVENIKQSTEDKLNIVEVLKESYIYNLVKTGYRQTIINALRLGDAIYADISLSSYSTAKYSNKERLTDKKFVSVMIMKLSRKLPHIIFDSKVFRGKNIKKSISKKQGLTLAGRFNEYFDVFVPIGYHIDSLSLITPEVMEALLLSKDYEIEIQNDTLVIIGYMRTDAVEELDRMKKSISTIHKAIERNTKMYRDTRLLKELAAKATTTHASKLKWEVIRDLIFVRLFITVIISAYLFPYIYMLFDTPYYTPKWYIGLFVIISGYLFVWNLNIMIKGIKENRLQSQKDYVKYKL